MLCMALYIKRLSKGKNILDNRYLNGNEGSKENNKKRGRIKLFLQKTFIPDRSFGTVVIDKNKHGKITLKSYEGFRGDELTELGIVNGKSNHSVLA